MQRALEFPLAMLLAPAKEDAGVSGNRLEPLLEKGNWGRGTRKRGLGFRHATFALAGHWHKERKLLVGLRL